jgi:hypothetical protein
LNYSYVDATFESPLTVPSPSNPYQDVNGNIQVEPGDHLPGYSATPYQGGHRLQGRAELDDRSVGEVPQ